MSKFLFLRVAEMPFTILLSALIGILVASYASPLQTYLLSVYDDLNPVVDYQSKVVGGDGDAVLIHIWGRKLRNCRYVVGSLNSYTVRRGVLYTASEQRMSGYPADRPTGAVDIGTWRVRPIADGERAQMWVLHDCDGRMVQSKIADVSLTE